MEHRWSPRKPVKMDVFINYQPLGLVRGEAKDVSLEGMFVETGRVTLPKNEEVDITFAVKNDHEKRILHMGAFVVHSSQKGAGLMFRSGAHEALEDALSVKTERRCKAS